MQRLFIIAIMFLGITAAKGQTVVQLNGQTNSSETIGSDPLSIPASALPSGSGSGSGSVSGSSAANGSASGASTSQSPLLLPGEMPDTSAQGATTTATAPGAPAPICPPPVPSTDGGSANLTEIAGASLNGC
jgi:hypothetical protein